MPDSTPSQSLTDEIEALADDAFHYSGTPEAMDRFRTRLQEIEKELTELRLNALTAEAQKNGEYPPVTLRFKIPGGGVEGFPAHLKQRGEEARQKLATKIAEMGAPNPAFIEHLSGLPCSNTIEELGEDDGN